MGEWPFVVALLSLNALKIFLISNALPMICYWMESFTNDSPNGELPQFMSHRPMWSAVFAIATDDGFNWARTLQKLFPPHNLWMLYSCATLQVYELLLSTISWGRMTTSFRRCFFSIREKNQTAIDALALIYPPVRTWWNPAWLWQQKWLGRHPCYDRNSRPKQWTT